MFKIFIINIICQKGIKELMEKFNIILKLGASFFKRYWIDYLALMIIPVLLLFASFFVFAMIVALGTLLMNHLPYTKAMQGSLEFTFGTIAIVLVAFLVSFVLFAYAFWKICFINYTINHAVFNFAKQNELKPLNCYLNEIKRDEKGLILFLLKTSLIAFLPFLPAFAFGFYGLYDKAAAMALLSKLPHNPVFFMVYAIVTLVWVLLLYPYLILMFQAYYYRESENALSIFKDCYKYLDSCAFLILIFSILAQVILQTVSGSIIGSIIGGFVSLFVSVLYSFWFYIKKFKVVDCIVSK